MDRSRVISLSAAFLVIVVCLLLPRGASAKVPLVVETAYGPVIGGISLGGLRSFKGIPYAKPPIGDLRWKAPQEPDRWSIPLLCDAFRSSCPSYPSVTDMDLRLETFDEDCLYLNLWTPAEGPDAGLPVMVFIHGGSLLTGSAAKRYYDGTYLAGKGVVVVTINYRLGAFGFFCHPELADQEHGGSYGNYGLLDQIAALEWVKGNIGAFGGDPSNVTIFGESAGAVSVLSLMSSGLAAGLFKGAISQSGAIPFNLMSKEEACSFWAKMAAKAGIEDFSSSLDELRGMDWQQVLKMNPSGEGQMPARSILELLCIDGLVLSEQPLAVFRAGKQASIPLIVGSNSDEMGLAAFEGPKTEEEYKKGLARYFGGYESMIMARYPFDASSPGKAYMDAISDLTFTYTSKLAAMLHSKPGNPVYHYMFGYAGKLLKAAGLGAFHASELLYVFGLVDTPAFSMEERTMARTMSSYWTAFAGTGRPEFEGCVQWPVSTALAPAGIYLDLEPAVKPDMSCDAYSFWSRIMDDLASTGRFKMDQVTR